MAGDENWKWIEDRDRGKDVLGAPERDGTTETQMISVLKGVTTIIQGMEVKEVQGAPRVVMMNERTIIGVTELESIPAERNVIMTEGKSIIEEEKGKGTQTETGNMCAIGQDEIMSRGKGTKGVNSLVHNITMERREGISLQHLWRVG